jgi:hypothetical protein
MTKKKIFSLASLLIANGAAVAQCALCTKTAQGFDAKAAQGINMAIIYLAFIPLAMMLGVFYYMYKSSKSDF